MPDGIGNFIDPEIYGGTRNPNVNYFGGGRKRRNPFQIGPNFGSRRPTVDGIPADEGPAFSPPEFQMIEPGIVDTVDVPMKPQPTAPAGEAPASPRIRQPRRFPALEAYQGMEAAPTQEQFPVSKKRMLAALALGIASGFGRGATERGVPFEVASGVTQAPYRKALSSYEERRRRLKESAGAEREKFEMETAAEREARAQEEGERSGVRAKRETATPVRSIRKKMPDGTHLIDIFVDEQGKEREVDRGLEGAQPRTDTTMTEWDAYMQAAGGDAAKALRMRNADLARLATTRAGGVDQRAASQAKLQAERRKQDALKMAERDFRDPQKRGFYRNQETLQFRKQQIQDAYENELAASGQDVTPFEYGPEVGGAPAAPKAPAPTLKPNEVMVIGPDGKRYALPKEQLAEAQKQGYKLAQ